MEAYFNGEIFVRRTPFIYQEYFKKQIMSVFELMQQIDTSMAIAETEEQMLLLNQQKMRMENILDLCNSEANKKISNGFDSFFVLKINKDGSKTIIETGTAGSVRYLSNISMQELEQKYQSLLEFMETSRFIGKFAKISKSETAKQNGAAIYIPEQPMLILYQSETMTIGIDELGTNLYVNQDIKIEYENKFFPEANDSKTVYGITHRIIANKGETENKNIFNKIISAKRANQIKSSDDEMEL